MLESLPQDVLTNLLHLSDAERAELAAVLIESLEHGSEPVDEVESAWSDEIKRRLGQIERGEVKTIPWDQAKAMILADERPDV
jgi:putative addiction module component (TIGR02574 family)